MKKLALSTALLVSFGLAQTAQAHPEHTGYLTESADSHVSTGFGGCWKIGNWSQDKAESPCDGKPVAAAPAPAPAPAPVVAPAAPEYVMQATQRSHIVYFDFDSSAVTDISDIMDTLSGLTSLTGITLTGHADKLGSNGYNDALARTRVNAVAQALTDAGVDADKITTAAKGENVPVKSCEGASNVKSCLAANRRVEVTINGERRVQKN